MKLSNQEVDEIINNQKLAYRKKVNKDKKTILSSLVKEIKNFGKKTFWKTYFNFHYIYLTFFFNIKNNEIYTNKISILIPTRERSVKFDRFIKSILNTTDVLKRLEILVLVDQDEPEFKEYFELVARLKTKDVNINLFQSDYATHAKRNNFLAKKCKGDVIFPANDDMIFITKNWDRLIDIEFSKIDRNRPRCLWVDSGNKYPFLFCHFPIVNRAWYKRLGYIGSELFNFWYLDTWICDLAKRSRLFIFSKKIKFKEYNAQANRDEIDKTYLKNISNNKMEKDLQIWEDSKNKRVQESLKLIKI